MILCFSGNGNTRCIAGMLAESLGDSVTELRRELMEDPDSHPLTLSAGERVVWMCPVHSWGIPPYVRRFMRRCIINGGDSAPHHLVVTMGDDAGLTHRMWRQEMESRGWDAVSSFGVIMPNTYVLMPGFDVDSPETAKAKLDAMPPRVAEIASGIKAGTRCDDIRQGCCAWLKSKVIYPGFFRQQTSGGKRKIEPFHAADCNGCNICARTCPTGNITIVKRADGSCSPVWGADCTLCLGCYNICPRHTIGYGKRTRGKGQYHCPL